MRVVWMSDFVHGLCLTKETCEHGVLNLRRQVLTTPTMLTLTADHVHGRCAEVESPAAVGWGLCFLVS